MTSARTIRQAVRAQIEAEISSRAHAALAVASAWNKLTKARERLATAEQEVAEAAMTATAQVPIADLAKLAQIPLPELRKIMKSLPKASDAPADKPQSPATFPLLVADQ
ncbi:MAG: hypothetical protein H0T78_11975 [Longispora sp.]|nr:hypothetical protein [Longispora sp. (in: high G+C Gram-positive bacteria)]